MSCTELALLPFRILWSLLQSLIAWLLGKEPKDIKGQVVLITGGGSGIGRQLAIEFARVGAKVVILDINEEWSAETVGLVAEIEGACTFYKCDLTERTEIAKVAAAVRNEIGEVDILVNNAGIFNANYFTKVIEQEIKRIVDVNIMAPFWLVKEFLPLMMERNEGHIVNVSSFAGRVGFPMMVDYSTTKFAIQGFGKALRSEMDRLQKNIQVTTVYPAITNTALIRDHLYRITFINPSGGMLKAEEVAETTVKGVCRNEKEIYIPNQLRILETLFNCLPDKTLDLMGLKKIGFHEK